MSIGSNLGLKRKSHVDSDVIRDPQDLHILKVTVGNKLLSSTLGFVRISVADFLLSKYSHNSSIFDDNNND